VVSLTDYKYLAADKCVMLKRNNSHSNKTQFESAHAVEMWYLLTDLLVVKDMLEMVANMEVRLSELNCVGWSVCSLLHGSLVDKTNRPVLF
jgi:hypothetical protein